MKDQNRRQKKVIFVTVLALAIVGFSAEGYLYYGAAKEVIQNTAELEFKILALEDENISLAASLKAEQKKNGMFETQINHLAGTVGKLDKLSKTDRELLQKYSKVYFLNENYIPEDLTKIPSDYIYEKDSLNSSTQAKEIKIHTKTFPFLQSLVATAKADGINLEIISGFRSFGEQSSLKNNYTVVYGSGANKFSADQGYSEHQLGTALDFTTSELGASFTGFGKTKAYEWLMANAYKFGFIISYPQGNSYYQFEPWHWRFVGKSLANRLHEEKQNFYDLDQRKIDSYLINIFD